MDGSELVGLIRDIYKLGPNDPITKAQTDYVISMLQPTNYLAKHHSVKGHKVTYQVHNKDMTKMFGHRPWQIDILNDQFYDKVIIKSRQLGLSEVGVSELIWFCDTHSYDAVKAVYTFPKICGAF